MRYAFRGARFFAAALVAGSVSCAASASGGQQNGSPDPPVPQVVAITCLPDGSIRLSTDRVLARSDGVHMELVNRVDEPTSVNGLGMDLGANEERDLVSGIAPGIVELACWPFSEHGGGDEPATTPLEVLDPDGLFVSGDVECDGVMSNSIADFVAAPDDRGPPPIDVARGLIDGLLTTDEVRYAGYPDGPGAVIVVRDGEVVASYSIVHFAENDRWVVEGSSICGSSGLR